MFLELLLALAGLGLGSFAGYRYRASRAKLNIDSAEAKAEQLLAEAKAKEHKLLEEAKQTEQRLLQAVKTAEQQLLLDAKEKAIGIVEEGKQNLARQEQALSDSQHRLIEREQLFDKTLLDFENKKTKIEEYKAELDVRAEELSKLHDEELIKLQGIANMSKDAATVELFRRVEEDEQESLLNRLRKLDEIAEEQVETKARKIIALAIQRFASSQVVDATTTFVDLPSDDMKGRIIGKEGRNIKAIEHLTGCELIIDDTPNSITISGFSPFAVKLPNAPLKCF